MVAKLHNTNRAVMLSVWGCYYSVQQMPHPDVQIFIPISHPFYSCLLFCNHLFHIFLLEGSFDLSLNSQWSGMMGIVVEKMKNQVGDTSVKQYSNV